MDMDSAKCFVLFGTSACHLCEQAEDVLAALLAQGCDWEVELVDIAENDNLMDRYALSIPVLQNKHSLQELCWPFDGDAVQAFARSSDLS